MPARTGCKIPLTVIARVAPDLATNRATGY